VGARERIGEECKAEADISWASSFYVKSDDAVGVCEACQHSLVLVVYERKQRDLYFAEWFGDAILVLERQVEIF